MSAVGEVSERKDRPAYARFERRAKEDKAASLKAGHYVAVDVDYALITPPYSKDVVELKVESWFKNMVLDVQNGRMPQSWSDQYHDAYDKFCRGEEIPLNGTAIKGWGVISPAQQATLIRYSILTVEDLAGVNDEGVRRIGMGSIELKNKAIAWLAQLRDKGPLTVEVAAVRAENETLKAQLATLAAQVATLLAARELTLQLTAPQAAAVMPAIAVSDLISDE